MTTPAKTTPTPPEQLSLPRRLRLMPWIDPLLGAMVAVFGFLASYAAYQAGILGGNSAESYFVGLSDLSDANALYASANQTYVQDNNLFIEMEIQSALLEDEAHLSAVIERLIANLSPEAQAAFNTETMEFDVEGYGAALYNAPDAFQDNSDRAFEAAQAWDRLGDTYELLALLPTLGLGFAAWASLMSEEGWTRYVFGLLGIVVLILCIVSMLMLELQPRPELVAKCAQDPVCAAQAQ